MEEGGETMTKMLLDNFDRILQVWRGSLSFGQRVRVLRSLFGIGQDGLAVRLGVDKQYISNMERERQLPGAETLAKFREVFGADTNLLFDSLKNRKKE